MPWESKYCVLRAVWGILIPTFYDRSGLCTLSREPVSCRRGKQKEVFQTHEFVVEFLSMFSLWLYFLCYFLLIRRSLLICLTFVRSLTFSGQISLLFCLLLFLGQSTATSFLPLLIFLLLCAKRLHLPSSKPATGLTRQIALTSLQTSPEYLVEKTTEEKTDGKQHHNGT